MCIKVLRPNFKCVLILIEHLHLIQVVSQVECTLNIPLGREIPIQLTLHAQFSQISKLPGVKFTGAKFFTQ